MSDTLFFLQIKFDKAGDITGESTMKGFEAQIEVESFRWSMKVKEVREAVANRASNAVSHQNLTLTSWFDLSTTNLLKCLETRDRFSLARLSCVHPIQPEDRPRDIMVIDLRGGYVEDVSLDLSGGKVGLWTVADSVTYFDDFRVNPR